MLIGPVGESALTHLSLVEPGSRLLEGMASPTVSTDGTNPHKDRVSLKSQGKYFRSVRRFDVWCCQLNDVLPFPDRKQLGE